MRRLATLFLAIGALLSLSDVARAASNTDATPDSEIANTEVVAADAASPANLLTPVDVLQVSGFFDSIVVDEIESAITRAEANGAQALILQMNSKAALVGRDEMRDVYERIEDASVPIAIWVGPSGARATGLVAQLLSAADATGMAPGTRIGRT